VNLIDGIKNQGQDYFRLNTSDPGGFFLGDWIRECWSWKFISVRHGGAIATIGNTALGYGLSGSEIAFSDLLSVMFFDVLTNQSKETLGEVYSQTIADYISSFGVNDEGDEIDRKTVDSLVLLGDPSLKIK